MSGSRSTDSRLAATRPNITSPSVTMRTVTGRLIAPSTTFMDSPPGSGAGRRHRPGIGRRRLGLDDLDARALLEPALPHGHDAVARDEAGEHLRLLALDGAEPDRG